MVNGFILGDHTLAKTFLNLMTGRFCHIGTFFGNTASSDEPSITSLFFNIRHSLSIFCKDNSNGGLMQIFARLNRLFHFANCETIWEV